MGSQPLVTVITSCYNHELYLDDYVNGLLAQTHRNIELVLFDDESTDGSWDKIQSHLPRLRAAFPRVICERHANVGPLEEWSRAIERATGDYLCILDSDDYYLPTKVEENVRYLQGHPEAGLVHSDIEHVWGTRVGAYKQSLDRAALTGRVLEPLLERNFINTCAACCRTEYVKRYADLRGYKARGYLMGDYPIWLRIAREAEVGYIPKPLARYRVLGESASRSKDPLKRYRFAKSFDQIKLDFIKESGLDSPVVEKVLWERHITLFYGGYTLMLREDCEQGYQWLAENRPAEFDTWKQRLRMRLVRNRPLWKAVRWVEETRPIRRLFGENRVAP